MERLKVGVTGGAGFIGSTLVDELINNNHEVIVLDVMPPIQGDVEFRYTDILNLDTCIESTKGLDVIYHLAAVSDVNIAIKNKYLTANLNIQGTLNILKSCEVNKISRIIYASTEWVYSCLEVEGKVITASENEALNVEEMKHIYTKTKYIGEVLCQEYSTLSNLNFTIMRFGIPYGPRGRAGTVVTNFLNNVINGHPINIHGDGSQFRNFIFIKDLVKGCVAMLNDKAINQTFNISGLSPITIKEVAQAVRVATNSNIEINYTNVRQQDFGGIVASNEKIKDVLDWYPSTSLIEGIKETYYYLLPKTAEVVG